MKQTDRENTRPKGSPMLLVLFAVVLIPTFLVGFAVVPGLRREPIGRRVADAYTATVAALRKVMGSGRLGDLETVTHHRTAAQSRAELIPDLEELAEEQLNELDRFRIALNDLAVPGTAVALDPDAGPEVLRAVLDDPSHGAMEQTGRLVRGRAATSGSFSLVSLLAGLVNEARDIERHLLTALSASERVTEC